MKAILSLRKWLVAFSLVLACFGASTSSAHAADAMSVVKAILTAAHEINSSIPSGNDVEVVFNCLGQIQDNDIATCASKLNGQYLNDSNVAFLIELYSAVSGGDFWNIVGVVADILKDKAPCIIADIMMPGTGDLFCSVLGELIEVGKAVINAVAAVFEFIADVGGAIYCDILGGFLGGCDDAPDTPPDQVAYAWVFFPKIVEGRNARLTGYSNYLNLKRQLEANALAQPAVLSIAVPSYYHGVHLPEWAVKNASSWFDLAVDKAWTSAMLEPNGVMTLVGNRRAAYNKPGSVPGDASHALDLFEPNQYKSDWDARHLVVGRCADQLIGQPISYAGLTISAGILDDWIASHSSEANQVKAKANLDWCKDYFWAQRNSFGEAFHAYVKANLCPLVQQNFRCQTIQSYHDCRDILGDVGREGECGISVHAVGLQTAHYVRDKLIEKGSQYPCETPKELIVPPDSSPVSLKCPRPSITHACEEVYANYSQEWQIPKQVMSCVLNMDPAYAQLVQDVKRALGELNSALAQDQQGVKVEKGGPQVAKEGQAMKSMAKQGLTADQAKKLFGSPLFFNPPGGDPLLVIAQGWDYVMEAQTYKSNNWGFKAPSARSGFDFPATPQVPISGSGIDGLSTPVIAMLSNIVAGIALQSQVAQEKVGQGNLIKQKIDPRQKVTNPAGLVATESPITVDNDPAGQVAGIPAQTVAGEAAGHTSHTMSGSLPPGSPPPGSIDGSPAREVAKLGAVPAGKGGSADLLFAGMPRIGGTAANWSGALMLEAGRATRTANGTCEFLLEYLIRNAGQEGAANFTSTVRNAAVPGSGWSHRHALLPPGGEKLDSGPIVLRPGQNSLEFVLDAPGESGEGARRNNRASLNVSLSGRCGAASPGLPTAAPGAVPPVGGAVTPGTAPGMVQPPATTPTPLRTPNLIKR